MRGGRTSVLAVALFLGLPGAASADESFKNDSLEVRVKADPFALEVVDRADGDVLHSLGGDLPGAGSDNGRYGPLGYSFDLRSPVLNNSVFGYYGSIDARTVWFHATRALRAERRGEAMEIEAATNDPLGHRLLVTLSRVAEDGVALRSRLAPGSGPLASVGPTASGASFATSSGERYLGFGERSNASDQTGREVVNHSEEGPFSTGRYDDVLRPLLPDFTFPTGPTTSNFPIPWLVSSRGLGVLIDQGHRSRFRLGNERRDAWQVEAEAPELRLTFFAGPRPLDVVRRYSTYAGRQPDPAPWIFGPWIQAPDSILEEFRREDVPGTVQQTYTHYLPCGAQLGNETAERALVERTHRLGYRITTYFNPHVCTTYEPVYSEAAERDLLVKNRAGEPYLLTNPFTRDGLVSEIDFTNPEGRALYARLLDDAIDAGYDGWMEDFGEYTPTDSVFSDGRDGREMHNLYPVLYHGASTDHTRKRMGRDAAVFIRSGWHGVQPYARVVWGGDPTEDWSCADGLCAAVNQLLSIGMSGVAYQGSDIGGFHAIVNDRTSDELNIRWLQVGAVSGVMRTQRNGYSFTQSRDRRSQVWSPAVRPIWRRYAKLRTQLLPYLEAASAEYQRTGTPIARHLSLVYPDDPAAIAREQEFMFGPDLFVAPVIRKGARERSLYLPKGSWVNFNHATSYGEDRGDLRAREATAIEGGRRVRVDAPLDELPMFARAGAVIPLLPPDVDSLAGLGEGKDLVGLSERRGRMSLLAFPHGTSASAIGDGERVASRELKGRRWQLRIAGKRTRRYDLQASLSTLRRQLRPCRVLVGDRRLRPLPRRRWSFDRATRVLRATTRLKRGRIVVQGRDRKRRCVRTG